jgi:phosphoribosylaminoimidazolecarboxamide formyltransferase/IMP cyclohydrolase
MSGSNRPVKDTLPMRPIRRALLSVTDKTGLADLARVLLSFGCELVSTGGTRAALVAAGLKVRDVSDLTGFPEMLDGRVKTLHPKVHGGLLYRRDDADHMTAAAAHGIEPIDLVVVNLYAFERVSSDPSVIHERVVENIDIGGPSMLRSAAKNYRDVAVLSDPEQYADAIAELNANKGALSAATREKLAAAAFARTAAYDAAISGYFARKLAGVPAAGGETFPPLFAPRFVRKQGLRYGENPHQAAAFYTEPGVTHACVATAEVLHGKELSYNNILDLDSALNLVREFARPAAVVLKHNNPCGAAVADTLAEAFALAYEGDPLSAFGGILGFNRAVDEATARQVVADGRFVECVIAPGYDEPALALLKSKKNLRVLRTGRLDAPTVGPMAGLDLRRVDGGLLVQQRDKALADAASWPVKTKREPTPAERLDLAFAWTVVKHVKSNAIVLAKAGQVVGVGAGQMSRVDSVQIAVKKAGDRARGAVLASDAFFPFRDNVDAAAAAGVSAIVQPGGSVRDADSVAACDEHGLAMVFTGVRHFRH